MSKKRKRTNEDIAREALGFDEQLDHLPMIDLGDLLPGRMVDEAIIKTYGQCIPRWYAPRRHLCILSPRVYETIKRTGTVPPELSLRWRNLEMIFVPMHDDSHWRLLVAQPRSRGLWVLDSANGAAQSGTTVRLHPRVERFLYQYWGFNEARLGACHSQRPAISVRCVRKKLRTTRE